MSTEQQFRQHRFRRPAGATEILLIRHGESEPAMPGKRFPLAAGHGDPNLHPNGRIQATAIANRLKDEQVNAIYTSSLRRTKQTAAPLATKLNVDPIEIHDLREIYLGDWEGGLYREKVAAGAPEYQEARRTQRWDAIPNGEANEHFLKRLKGALAEIHAANEDALVVAFVHGAVIGHIVAGATGAKDFAFLGADNGSITRIVVLGESILVRSFNETSHLPADLD